MYRITRGVHVSWGHNVASFPGPQRELSSVLTVLRFFASEENKTGRPPEGMWWTTAAWEQYGHQSCQPCSAAGKVFPPPPVNIDVVTSTHQPFSLKKASQICQLVLSLHTLCCIVHAVDGWQCCWDQGEGQQVAVWEWRVQGGALVTVEHLLHEVTNCAVFVRLCLYPHLNCVGSLVLFIMSLLHWNAPVYYSTEIPWLWILMNILNWTVNYVRVITVTTPSMFIVCRSQSGGRGCRRSSMRGRPSYGIWSVHIHTHHTHTHTTHSHTHTMTERMGRDKQKKHNSE